MNIKKTKFLKHGIINRIIKLMNTYDKLEKIKEMATKDISLKEKILDTRKTKNPYSRFCLICNEYGIDISPMELVNAGEEYYTAMKRSTNGGGENSPILDGQDDFYEMLLIQISETKREN